jgi:diguanylate cyclase (GGDEF)-like protein/PAS domain S-box-containing protein
MDAASNLTDPLKRALEESEARFEAMLESVFCGACVHSDGVIERANPALEAMLGAPKGGLRGRVLLDLLTPAHRSLMAALLKRASEGAIELTGERLDGSPVHLEVRSRGVRWHGREAVLTVLRDLTSAKRAEAELHKHAYFDGLTGLPNRSLFTDRLDAALREAEESGAPLAVMIMDLDRFKVVNDTLGHGVGDLLIREVSARVGRVLRQGDTLARLGGDEFGLLFTGLKRSDDAAGAAKKVLESLAAPFFLEGRQVHTAGSMGVSLYPENGSEAVLLVKRAELAMYRAKDRGKNTHQLYNHSMEKEEVDRLSLENDLRKALERDELELFYQPQVDPHSLEVVGLESLVRWRHPERGLLYPDSFIPLAEESRLILPIGELLLKKACQQAREWLDQGLPPVTVSVNLSAYQFQKQTLSAIILKTLDQTGLPAKQLDVEITESIAMQNPAYALLMIRDIAEMGVSISLDDFGKGYSSLAYLSQFPIHTLKLDMSFIHGLGKDPKAEAIVTASLSMAHAMGLEVVAEGVETQEQYRFLREHRCDRLQGYLFSRPVPAGQVAEILAKRKIDLTS